MASRKEEQNFYDTIYLQAFGKDALYFYQNDSITIFKFMKKNFWGESLQIRIKLLSKLLYFDSYTNPQMSRDLRMKSTELSEYITHSQE
ncbi:MAG: hypothetical protein LBU84_17690 [Prevotella sp.]|jgi:hypothetical protein|nr:hypothetical protein [Prevotella sp.]